MNRGGQEGIDTKVKIAATEMWERPLCTNDEKLTIETRLIIEYTLSGLTGLISICIVKDFSTSTTYPKK